MCINQVAANTVKSRLFPLSPLDKILEWLIERLPRSYIQIELTPAVDISITNEREGEYKATGDSPLFSMTFIPAVKKGAWYYLEAALVRNNGSRVAYIHAEIEANKDKATITIPIPTNLRGSVREVFYLPSNVTALSWQPTAAPGFFSQSPLLLHKITLLESSLRRLHRVIIDLRKLRQQTAAFRYGLSWPMIFGNLQDAYLQTATMRIQRLMGNDYASFILHKDTLKKSEIMAMRKNVLNMPQSPLISLIMKVQCPIQETFKRGLDSILSQIYPNWELLLIGDFSVTAHGHEIALEYQHKNNRIKTISMSDNSDLANALNTALKQAKGKFVTHVNQYDILPCHALYMLAQEINLYPDVHFIYTDHDYIDENKNRHDPCFKPDWNPDLFYSHNYLSNLSVYRLEQVLELGGYHTGFETAEEYDLCLRYLKNVSSSKIRHIPKVLCHIRVFNDNTAVSKPPQHEVTHQSGKRALEAFFEGSSITIKDGPAPTFYRIKHPLPKQLPLVSIIIPTRDRVDILKKCINSIQQKTDYPNWELLIIDNQSVELDTHDYFEKIQADSRITILRYAKPFNYSALNNFAVKYAQGEILALVNNDIEVIAKEWLSEMVSHAIRPEIGAVGAKLLYSNGAIQHAGVILGLGGVAGHAHKYLKANDPGYCHRAVVTQNLSAVTGACLVVKKTCYQEVGGLNELDLVVAFNDIDFCLKLMVAGYRNIFTPYSLLYHHESISRGRDDTPEKHNIFIKEFNYMKNTWNTILQQDAAYNCNLTLEFENFSLKSFI